MAAFSNDPLAHKRRSVLRHYVIPALKDLGFRRHERLGSWHRSAGQSVWTVAYDGGWLAEPTHTDLSVTIGVGHLGLQTFLASAPQLILLGSRDPTAPLDLILGLKDLDPACTTRQRPEYVLHEETQPRAVGQDIVARLHSHAVPFWRRFPSYEALIPLLDGPSSEWRPNVSAVAFLRLAAWEWLHGRAEAAYQRLAAARALAGPSIEEHVSGLRAWLEAQPLGVGPTVH